MLPQTSALRRSWRWCIWAGLLGGLLLLSACVDIGNPFAGADAPPAPAATTAPTPAPVPTDTRLDATATMEHGGFGLDYPADWQTRQLSRTLTIAPREEALDATSPGDDLVIVIDLTPLSQLEAWYGPQAVESTESLFEISSGGPQQAGYTMSETVPITLDGSVGLAADLQASGGAGRLVVLNTPPHMVRILGQAAPHAWAEQVHLFEAIVASLRFFEPEPLPTPTPIDQASQPELLTNGPAGFVLRVGGNTGDMAGRFVATRGLAVAEDGSLYIAESQRGIWVFEPDGTLRTTFGGEELLDAYDVVIGPEGDLYVADYGRNAITRFQPDGTLVERWGSSGEAPDQFGLLSPQRIDIGQDGDIYALDSRVTEGGSMSSVIRFDTEGNFIERIQLPAGSSPTDLAIDPVGNIYLAEPFSNSVVKVSQDGLPIDRIGNDLDENGITPGALDVDADGNVFVATWGRGVLKFTFDGRLLATAGTAAEPGTTPGAGEFSLPNGLAIGAGDVVWVSDNDGEYSAITALRVENSPEGQALLDADATASATPIPENARLRQWASTAEASSFYDGYPPESAVGPPDVGTCNDSQNAWASADPNGLETLELGFETPVFADGVVVHQNHQPGFISEIELIDERGNSESVYTSKPGLVETCPYVLEVPFDLTLARIVAVRITVDQRTGANWSEIDAVQLVGVQG